MQDPFTSAESLRRIAEDLGGLAEVLLHSAPDLFMSAAVLFTSAKDLLRSSKVLFMSAKDLFRLAAVEPARLSSLPAHLIAQLGICPLDFFRLSVDFRSRQGSRGLAQNLDGLRRRNHRLEGLNGG